MARDLEVRHCRALIALHEGGGVGAAARALGVAQSTLSETLLSLERLIGAPVTVRRIGREATLTAAAEALLPFARSLIATSEAALAANASHSRATIQLGTVESLSSFLLPAPLHDFRGRWPQVDVRINIGLCEDLRRRVAQAELDAALTIEGADLSAGEDVWPARLELVVGPGHPLAGAEADRAALARHPFLLADSEGAFNGLMRSWLGKSGQPPRLESAGSVDGVKRGLATGDVIGVLPDYAVAEELAAGSLVAVKVRDPLPPIALRLTARDVVAAGSPLESLTAIIRDALGPQSGAGQGEA
jgi:DNA-binding transcriptional LysR family regulator